MARVFPTIPGLFMLAIAACSTFATPTEPPPRPYGEEEIRAIWITRYDYRTEEEVRSIVRNCKDLGLNRLLFQVRGQADAYYASALEPWSDRLGGKDPGFDPLAVACEEAGRAGVALEAWINVMPLWKGTEPPADPAHPFHTKPGWRVVGSDGRPQALNAHYVCVNPADPEVRAHLAAVAADIAKRYRVDGIHLDYIRFVTDLEKKLDFPFDAPTLAAFGKDPASQPEEWKRFKAEQVSQTVRAIREAVRAARPGCAVSAAAFPTAEGRARTSQDAARWLAEGWVEAVYPMLYSIDDAEFASRLEEARATLPGRVLPGLGVYRHPDAATTLRHVGLARQAGARGFALFCYASFWPSRDADEVPERNPELQAARRAAFSAR